MLVDQPGGGERVAADLAAGDLGCLQGRGDDHQSGSQHLQPVPGGREGGGLAGSGRTLDDQQPAVAGQGADHPLLGVVELAAADFAAHRDGHRGGLGARGQAGDQVCLDLEHAW